MAKRRGRTEHDDLGQLLRRAAANDIDLDHIDLQSFDLTPQDIKDVGKAMRDNSNVRELSVDGRKLGEKGVKSMFTAMEKNRGVSTIHLGYTPETSGPMMQAIQSLQKKQPTLRQVRFHRYAEEDGADCRTNAGEDLSSSEATPPSPKRSTSISLPSNRYHSPQSPALPLTNTPLASVQQNARHRRHSINTSLQSAGSGWQQKNSVEDKSEVHATAAAVALRYDTARVETRVLSVSDDESSSSTTSPRSSHSQSPSRGVAPATPSASGSSQSPAAGATAGKVSASFSRSQGVSSPAQNTGRTQSSSSSSSVSKKLQRLLSEQNIGENMPNIWHGKKEDATDRQLRQAQMVIEDLMQRLKDADEAAGVLAQRIRTLEHSAGSAPSKQLSSTPSVKQLRQTQNADVRTLNMADEVGAERLGSGGSGCLIRSCYLDGFLCVVKELDLRYSNERSLRAFNAEVALLQRLPPNPHVVRFLAHRETPHKKKLFITKYPKTLGDLIREHRLKNQPFSIQQTWRFASQIIKGISFLHAQGVVHRDLKPDNIFLVLNLDGHVSRCLIGDFDTAKRLGSSRTTNTMIGTPVFMAPEMVGQEDYSYAVDVYSFGILLYEIITMKEPYEGCEEDVDKMVEAGPPVLILPASEQRTEDSLYMETAKVFDPIYDMCTRRNPKLRPSAEQVRQKLLELDGVLHEHC